MKNQKVLLHSLPLVLVAVLLIVLYSSYSRRAPLYKGGFTRSSTAITYKQAEQMQVADSLQEILYAGNTELLVRSENTVVSFRYNHKIGALQKNGAVTFPEAVLKQSQMVFNNSLFIISSSSRSDLAFFTKEGRVVAKISTPGMAISRMAAFSASEFLVRKFKAQALEQEFAIIDSNGKMAGKPDSTAIPSVNDAGLAYDGRLTSNGSQAVYTCFFTNRMAAFNADGKIKWLTKTIDTFSQPPLVISNTGKTEFRYGANLRLINKSARIYNDQVFVHSVIAAENDNAGIWSRRLVLDVYALATGKYLHSLYLERDRNDFIKDFYITAEGTIIALGRNKLYVYNKDL